VTINLVTFALTALALIALTLETFAQTALALLTFLLAGLKIK
jgi:hypothetical protein